MKERELIQKAVHQDMPDAESIRLAAGKSGQIQNKQPFVLKGKKKMAWVGMAAAAVAVVLLASTLPRLLSDPNRALTLPTYTVGDGNGAAGPMIGDDLGSDSGLAENPGQIMPGEGNPELADKYAALEPAASRLMSYFETNGYPDFVGGLYFNEEPGLVVSLSDDTAANRAWVSDLAEVDDISFTTVDYSYNELLAVQDAISAGMTDGSLAFVLSTGIDVVGGRLEIAVNSVLEADLLKLAALDTAGRGDALYVIYTEDLAEVYDDLAAR